MGESFINIPRFQGGALGKLDYTHMNQLVDRINELSARGDIESASGVRASMLEEAQPTQALMTEPIFAKIGEEVQNPYCPTSQPNPVRFWQWEEVAYDFRPAQCVPINLPGGRHPEWNPVDAHMSGIATCVNNPGGDFTNKLVLLHHSRMGWDSTNAPDLFLFYGSESVSSSSAPAIITGAGGAIGDPYTVFIFGSDFAPIEIGWAYNMMEKWGAGELDDEINTEHCPSTPTWTHKRLPTNIGLTVHFLKEHGEDEENPSIENDWIFHSSLPFDVLCECPEDKGLLTPKGSFNMNVETAMFNGTVGR